MAAEQDRVELAKLLIQDLKATVDHIHRISTDIGDASGNVLGKVYEDHLDKIGEKVDQFNHNVDRVKAIHQEITKAINDWYTFTQNDKELIRITFPIRITRKRKEVQKAISGLKDEISSLLIRNRLLREDIVRLESDLEFEATQRLKKDVRYEDYISHLTRKTAILEELNYLLPTLPGKPVRIVNTQNLQECLEQL